MGAERDRVAGFGKLEDGFRQAGDWYRWGPYVSERAWATVREDYSADGEAWDYLPHDHARRGLSLGRGRDRRVLRRSAAAVLRPGLLERRATRSSRSASSASPARGEPRRGRQGRLLLPRRHPVMHSYLKFLYKYPQAEFPYERLDRENARRSRHRARVRAARHRRSSTSDRYFDIEVEYAKARPEDLRSGIERPTGARGRAVAHPAAPLVPQHLGVGPQARPVAED